MATAEFSKFAGILSAALSQHHLSGFEIAQLEFTEYCYLINREFKILVMKKLSELQENSEKQFGKLRNKNNEQKEYFTKEIETQNNNNQTELELKDSIDEMKNH